MFVGTIYLSIHHPLDASIGGSGVVFGFFVHLLLEKSRLEDKMIVDNKPDLVLTTGESKNKLILKNVGKGSALFIRYNLYLHLNKNDVFCPLTEPLFFCNSLEVGELKPFDEQDFFKKMEPTKEEFLNTVKNYKDQLYKKYGKGKNEKKPVFFSNSGKTMNRWSLVFSYRDIWGTSYFSVFKYERSFNGKKDQKEIREGNWIFSGTFMGEYLGDATHRWDIGFSALADQKKHQFFELEGFLDTEQKSKYSEEKSGKPPSYNDIDYLQRLFKN